MLAESQRRKQMGLEKRMARLCDSDALFEVPPLEERGTSKTGILYINSRDGRYASLPSNLIDRTHFTNRHSFVLRF
jgi:hypothetical protein